MNYVTGNFCPSCEIPLFNVRLPGKVECPFQTLVFHHIKHEDGQEKVCVML